MAYKNFFLRSIFSIIFITIYCVILSLNFSYIPYLIILIYVIIIYEILVYFKKYKFLPFLYTLISICFFLIIDFNQLSFFTFNLFIFTIIIFDIFSYLVGKIFGINKITKISPNKTFEGLFGGAVISFAISLLVLYFLNDNITFSLVLFIILTIVSAFIGDIIESYFKRKNNIKNSSNLIPGHGGVFDRFDSFMFSIIFYSIIFNYIIWI